MTIIMCPKTVLHVSLYVHIFKIKRVLQLYIPLVEKASLKRKLIKFGLTEQNKNKT